MLKQRPVRDLLMLLLLLSGLVALFSPILFTTKIVRAPDILNEFYWGVYNAYGKPLWSLLRIDLATADWNPFINSGHSNDGGMASMQFVYPQPYSGVFSVPTDWIRTDKKYGHIRLVPGTQAFAAPLSAWVMQVMGAGRTVPQMIQLRYTAGLRNAAQQYPELVDLVQRMAALRILQAQFVGASSSISADGLSESRSLDLDKFQGDIDQHLERLRQVIHGVQCLVF